MKELKFGDYKIQRPTDRIEKKVRKTVETKIFKKFESKTYTNADDINNIIKYMSSIYSNMLDENLNKVASIEFLEFILNQYDITYLIDLEYRDDEFWKEYGPIIRRALKYIGERIVMSDSLKKKINMKEEIKQNIICNVIIAAEQLVSLYIQSDSTFRLVPQCTELTLAEGEDIYYDLKINNEYYPDQFIERIGIWHENMQGIELDIDIEDIYSTLEDSFIEEFGVSLKQINIIIQEIITHFNNKKVTAINKNEVISFVEEKYNIERENVNKILSGFIINCKNLNSEKREVFKPKQEYRAFYRGFFEVKLKKEIYLVWAKNMCIENICVLFRDIKFNKMPKEWKTENIKSDLGKISRSYSEKFEQLVKTSLEEKLKIYGRTNFKHKIGKIIDIPPDVGEIDYLGIDIDKNEFLVIECKMIAPGTEPRLWHDDIIKFTTRDKYIEKFNKKIDFISKNKKEITEYLLNELKVKKDNCTTNQLSQQNILITYYPSIMKMFVNDSDYNINFEIYDLQEFIEESLH